MACANVRFSGSHWETKTEVDRQQASKGAAKEGAMVFFKRKKIVQNADPCSASYKNSKKCAGGFYTV